MIVVSIIISILSLIVSLTSLCIGLYNRLTISNNLKIKSYLSQIKTHFCEIDNINYGRIVMKDCHCDSLKDFDRLRCVGSQIYSESSKEVRAYLDDLTSELNDFCNKMRNTTGAFQWDCSKIKKLVCDIEKEILMEDEISDGIRSGIKKLIKNLYYDGK